MLKDPIPIDTSDTAPMDSSISVDRLGAGAADGFEPYPVARHGDRRAVRGRRLRITPRRALLPRSIDRVRSLRSQVCASRWDFGPYPLAVS